MQPNMLSPPTPPQAQCTCNRYWKGPACNNFEIPDESLTQAIFVLNSITLIGWVTMFGIALLGVLLEPLPIGKSLNRVISLEGVHIALIYFQSFTLILSNNKLFTIGHHSFRRFYLLMLDIPSYRDLPPEQITVWTESALFLPKCIIFIVGIMVFYFMKHPRIRSIMLQFSLLCYFLFVSSLFERFGENRCSQCTNKYNIPSTLFSLILLSGLVYLKYRLWKILAANKNFFESSDYETIGHSMRIYFKTQYFQVLYRVLTFVFLP